LTIDDCWFIGGFPCGAFRAEAGVRVFGSIPSVGYVTDNEGHARHEEYDGKEVEQNAQEVYEVIEHRVSVVECLEVQEVLNG